MSQPKQNGPLGSLVQMATASGDRLIQLITIGIVVLGNGSNWFATLYEGNVIRHQSRHQVDRALQEINELHSELFNALERQKEIQKDVHALLMKQGVK